MGIANKASSFLRSRGALVALRKRSGSDGHPRRRCSACGSAIAATLKRKRSFVATDQESRGTCNGARRCVGRIRASSAPRGQNPFLELFRKGSHAVLDGARGSSCARDGFTRGIGAARARRRIGRPRGGLERG